MPDERIRTADHLPHRKLIHSISVSALVHATEDKHRVLDAVRLLVPNDVAIEQHQVTGHFGNPITILKARTERPQAIHQIIRVITTKLSNNELMHVQKQIAQHIDHNCNLFIRFEKQKAARGILTLGTEDPILTKIKIAAYPACHEVATEIARELWKDAPLR